MSAAIAAGAGILTATTTGRAEPVGAWRFDGDLASAVEPGQDGVFHGSGTPQYVTVGGRTCLSLDGNDQYVTVAGDGALDLDQGSFSIAAWFRVLSVPDARREALVAGKADASNLANYALTVDYNNRIATVTGLTAYGYTRRTNGANASVATVVYWVEDPAFINLVLTYDAAVQTLSLYRDAALRESLGGPDLHGPIAAGGPFTIGRNPYGTFLRADIDEVRVYGHALAEPDILALYNNGLGPPPGVLPTDPIDVSPAGMTEVMAVWFDSHPGRTYRLQSTRDPVQGLWTDARYLIEGTGGEALALDPIGFDAGKIYRIVGGSQGGGDGEAENLALSSRGAMVYVSSFANTATLYSENLIDGEALTVWQTYDVPLPQWIELRWPRRVTLTQVALRPAAPTTVSAWQLAMWEADQWVPLGTASSPVIDFPPASLTRLRATLTDASGPPSQFSAIETLGVAPPGPPAFNGGTGGAAVLVTDAVFDPPLPRPGDTVHVHLQLRPASPLDRNYFIEIHAGEEEINRDRSNYEVASAVILPEPGMQDWAYGTPVWVSADLSLPSFTPDGEFPLRLRAAATDGSGNTLAFFPPEVTFPVQRFDGPADPPADVFTPPLFWALQSPSYERFHEYAAAGPTVFHLQVYPYRVEPNTDYATPHLAFLDQHIRNLLRTTPQAQVIVELDLRASGAWRQAHPNALLLDAFGSPSVESVHAVEYRQAVTNYLHQVISFVGSQPYADRIIGYIPEFGPLTESTMGGVEINEGQVDRAQWTIGDWSPQAIAAFRDFLRDKYADDVGDLRTAWNDGTVDFDTALPDRAAIVNAAPDHNLFRDPQAGRMRADYLEFLSSAVPTAFLDTVADTIKQAAGAEALVGFYYGYVLEGLRGVNPPCGVQQNNHFWFPRMIETSRVDFYVSPLNYEHSRRAGGRFLPMQPYASIGLHGKLYVAEMDYRTFISGHTTYGRQHSQRETVAVLQRDLASTLIGDSGAWFADWSSGAGRVSHGFFLDDQILATIDRAHQVHRDALGAGSPPAKTAEIAVIVSPQTPWHQDCAYPAIMYNRLIRSMVYEEMAAVGAPFDILMIDDLERQDVRDQYRLFVLTNPFYLSAQQRTWIDALKSAGRTLPWFYAPGYVSDEHGLSAAQVAQTTGLGVQLLDERSTPLFRTAEDVLVTLTPFSSELNFSTIMPTEIYPNFLVDDPLAAPLGWDDQGRVRFTERDFGTWRSVYSAVPDLPRALLREIAETAGVHLYVPLDIVIDANDRYLMVHHGDAMARQITVYLPQSRTVQDLYSGELTAVDVDQFDLLLPPITTRVFELSLP